MKRVEKPDYDNGQDYVHYYALAGQTDRLEGAEEGWYETEAVDGFRAGSYGGYNVWRALLCRVMLGVEPRAVWNDPDKWRSQPFYGLINFADNEGCIGPVWSARLAKEFAEGRERFHAHPEVGDYERSKYDEWMKAFEAAAQNGCVEFH